MKALVIALLIMMLSSACRRDASDSAVPGRYAYPRIELYDTVYHSVDVAGLTIDVNDAAVVTSSRPGWLDIAYPRYGAVLYLSVVRADDVAGAVANRRQRISLNLGGARATTRTFSSGDFLCQVVESADAAATPVMLLAFSDDGTVVSGTVNLSGATAPADSIRPVVEALSRDAVKMLSSLR